MILIAHYTVVLSILNTYNLTKEHRKKTVREIFLGVKSRKF
jgi:hypothetical protein